MPSSQVTLRLSHLLWPLQFCTVCCWLGGRVSWVAPLADSILRWPPISTDLQLGNPPGPGSCPSTPLGSSSTLSLPRLPVPTLCTPTSTSKFLRLRLPSQNISAFPSISSPFSGLRKTVPLWQPIFKPLFPLAPLPQESHTWLPCLGDKQAQVSPILKKGSLVPITFFPPPPPPALQPLPLACLNPQLTVTSTSQS